jgi:5-methylcytosine-specific restriction endonuclease McrA
VTADQWDVAKSLAVEESLIRAGIEGRRILSGQDLAKAEKWLQEAVDAAGGDSCLILVYSGSVGVRPLPDKAADFIGEIESMSLDYSKRWKSTVNGRVVMSVIRESGSDVCVKCMKIKRAVDMGPAHCKQCTSVANKKWREGNREYNKERLAKWDRENRDKRVERLRVRSMTEEQRQRKNFLMRQWRKNNPERTREFDNSKRAKRRGAEGKFTNAEWKAIVNHFSGRCVYCGDKGKMTVEHIVPLSRGGRNNIQNIVPACLNCNCSKNSKTVKEWQEWAS